MSPVSLENRSPRAASAISCAAAPIRPFHVIV
jgi:hypothetical protein